MLGLSGSGTPDGPAPTATGDSSFAVLHGLLLAVREPRPEERSIALLAAESVGRRSSARDTLPLESMVTKETLQDDPVLSILLAAEVLSADVLERIRAAGHRELRYSHGFVFQVLVPGPASVGALAGALGVTSQAVSQSVAELERLGYVERRRSDADGRRRLVALTAAGQDAVRAGRAARAAVSQELAQALGGDRAQELAAALADVLDARGAMDAIRGRRVRPVS